jgi:hypothetical protein
MAIDFDNPIPTKSDSGNLLKGSGAIVIDENYITLWRHRPSLNVDGKMMKESGTVATERYPGQDKMGLLSKAFGNGWFPWPVGTEPTRDHLMLYRRMDAGYETNDRNREAVLSAWRACTAILVQAMNTRYTAQADGVEAEVGGEETGPTVAEAVVESSATLPPPAALLVCPVCDEWTPRATELESQKKSLRIHMGREHNIGVRPKKVRKQRAKA